MACRPHVIIGRHCRYIVWRGPDAPKYQITNNLHERLRCSCVFLHGEYTSVTHAKFVVHVTAGAANSSGVENRGQISEFSPSVKIRGGMGRNV